MRTKSFTVDAVRAAGLAGVLATSVAASGANATAVLFNLGSPTGNLGTTETYTNAATGLSIIATGYNAKGKKTDLYGKNGGGDEVGLGLTTDTTGDHEIQFHEGFVQLDLSDLFGKVKSGSTFFATGSATEGEEWGVYGSNKAGTYNSSNLLSHGTVETSQLFKDLGTYTYYDFVELNQTRGQGNNFLIAKITTTTGVPEPATWAMMLIGFAGVGAAVRMSRRSAAVTA